MPLTISNQTGDGILSDQIDCSIQLPDSGGSVTVTGTITPAGGARVSLTGSPVNAPPPPATGSLIWALVADRQSGALSVLTGTGVTPAIPATTVLLSTQTLTASSSDMALVPDTTPDTF